MSEIDVKFIELRTNSFISKNNNSRITKRDVHSSKFNSIQNKAQSGKFIDLLKSKIGEGYNSSANSLNGSEVKNNGEIQSKHISEVAVNNTLDQKLNPVNNSVEEEMGDKKLSSELEKALAGGSLDMDVIMKMLAELLGNLINLNTDTEEVRSNEVNAIDGKNSELSIDSIGSIGSINEVIKTIKAEDNASLITDISDSINKVLNHNPAGDSSEIDDQLTQILQDMVASADLTDVKLLEQIKSTIDAYGLMKEASNRKSNDTKTLRNEIVGISDVTIVPLEKDTKVLPEVRTKDIFIKSMVELLVKLTNNSIGNDLDTQDKSNSIINNETNVHANKLYNFLQKKKNLDKVYDGSQLYIDNKTDSLIVEDMLKDNDVNNLIVNNFREDKNTTVKANEDKLLKSLILGDEDNKISKVNTFMLQLNNSRQDVSKVIAPEELLVSKNNTPADILKAVKYMNLNNIKELTVKVTPKELGEIVIKLSMETGIMKANIAAKNIETYNILNSNLGEIRNALNNNEIKMQNVSVNIYQEDTTFFKESFNQSSNGGNNHSNQNSKAQVETDFIDEDTTRLIINDNNLNILV